MRGKTAARRASSTAKDGEREGERGSLVPTFPACPRSVHTCHQVPAAAIRVARGNPVKGEDFGEGAKGPDFPTAEGGEV